MAVNSVRAAGDPYFVFAGEQRALDALEARPATGRRARARLRRATCCRTRPDARSTWARCRGRRTGRSAWSETRALFEDRHVRRRARARSCARSGARFALRRLPARACATWRPTLRPLLEEVRRFGCATVYVLRRHAGTAAAARREAGAAVRRGGAALRRHDPRRHPAQRRGADARRPPPASPTARCPTATSGGSTRRASPTCSAACGRLFGPSLLVWRIVRVLCDAGVAVLAYALAVRGGASARLALVSWLVGGARDGVSDAGRIRSR